MAKNAYAICTDSIAKTAGTTKRSEWSEAAKERYDRCIKDVKKESVEGNPMNKLLERIKKLVEAKNDPKDAVDTTLDQEDIDAKEIDAEDEEEAETQKAEDTTSTTTRSPALDKMRKRVQALAQKGMEDAIKKKGTQPAKREMKEQDRKPGDPVTMDADRTPAEIAARKAQRDKENKIAARGAELRRQRAQREAKGSSKDDWIQGAVDPEHKGYCTPMTKSTCTPARKALAKRFKKAARKKKAKGGTGWQGKV